MKTTGSLPSYKNSFYNLDFVINDPASGFKFHLMETGSSLNAYLVSISGEQGYLFDQSGVFYNGYKSGTPFNVKIYYDHSNETFTYYHNDGLVANYYDVTGFSQGDGVVNSILFEKEETSSVSVEASGIIG